MTRSLAKVFGAILLIIGVIGFFSNSFIGANGYFLANIGLNIVNILLGIVLFAVSSDAYQSGLWLKIIGAVYALLAIIAFAVVNAIGVSNVLGFMSFNSADSWLYLIGGAVMFIAGFAEVREVRTVHMNRHSMVH